MQNTINIDSAIMEPIKYLMTDPTIEFELALNECGEYDVRIDNDFIVLKPEELFHTLRIVHEQRCFLAMKQLLRREKAAEARINAALYDFSYTMLEFEANREQVLDANLERRIARKMY